MSLACRQRDRITHDKVGLPEHRQTESRPSPSLSISPIPVAPAPCSPMQPQP